MEQPLLALLWRSVGPYHIARASAAAELLQREVGIRTVVIELCDREQTHAWKVDRASAPVQIKTIMPGAQLNGRAPDLVRQTLSVLDELHPKFIAIAGYDRREMRAALQWARRNGAVKVLMSETKWDDSPRPWWKCAMLKRHIAKYDAGLVSGSAAGEFLITLGIPRARIFRQYGAVDNAYFASAAQRAREQDLWPRPDMPRPYFIVSSRLHEELKNIWHLLASYEKYRRQCADPWALVICGDGKDRPQYERLVQEKILKGVSFEGFKQADELALYYARAACFVHPARREAWGLVVNEAMAAGLPVIVSRTCGAAYDLVKDGRNGFCFDPDGGDSLARAMLRIHEMSDVVRDVMGRASQEMIADWGVERFAAGLRDAINSVNLNGRR
jgi:glycosyltransferase involved in cell wall biosynthesis